MLKRVFDVASSAIAILILLPAILVVAALILIKDGRPVLYRQRRVGQHGRHFHVLKFRTMTNNADSLTRLTPSHDPRITRVGHFLRESNLDELPQLWNVLRGDMSIVGPRPEVPEFVDLSDPRWQKALKVRPGLTYPGTLKFRRQGLLLDQHDDYVAYYKSTLLPIKLTYAGEYVDAQTFWGDIKVIFATIWDIVRGDAAANNGKDS